MTVVFSPQISSGQIWEIIPDSEFEIYVSLNRSEVSSKTVQTNECFTILETDGMTCEILCSDGIVAWAINKQILRSSRLVCESTCEK